MELVNEMVIDALRATMGLLMTDTIEEAFQEFYRVLLGGLLIDSAAPKMGHGGVRSGRATARRTSAKTDVGADEVGTVLMAAWNRD